MAAEYKLSIEDCKSILQQHLHAKPDDHLEILNFQEVELSEDVEGIMGGYYKLQIRAKLNHAPITTMFFEKRMRTKHAMQRELIRQSQVYKKERFAYEFLPTLETVVDGHKCDYMPRMYLTVAEEMFVFEDLGESGYLVNKSGTFQFDMAHLLIALDSIAKLHAVSIIYENYKSQETGKAYKLPDEFGQYLEEYLYVREKDSIVGRTVKTCKDAVVAIVDIAPQFVARKDAIRAKFLAQLDKVSDLLAESDTYCNVLCHGDLWSNNLMFRYENDTPVHCKLIDFQGLRYTVPATDVLTLIHFANDSEFCATHETELLDHYYKCVARYLQQSGLDVNDYMTAAQFEASVEYVRPYIMVHKVCSSMLWYMDFDTGLKDDDALYTKFLYETKVDACVQMYQTHDAFRCVVNDAFTYLNKL